jgi:two-component system cell cycle response regulator
VCPLRAGMGERQARMGVSEAMPATPREHPPLVVIANSQEWHTRSLESILGPHGYAVLRAYTGKQALEHCRTARPDIVIVHADLPDMDGLDLCRTLRDDPILSPSTPILVTSVGHASRHDRLAALRAGAWDYLGSALDDEELPLRLDTYVKAKFDADRVRDESLLDQLTGLYSARGLARRARELGSLAFRHHEPFACVVLSPVVNGSSDEATAEAEIQSAVERLARAIKERSRVSDATGRLGPTEFAIVAQGTDGVGAMRLAERLTNGLRASSPADRAGIRIVAGYDVVADYHDAPIDPPEMLARASKAMRLSRIENNGKWIRQFEAGAPN